jgi:hypothetical protein
MASIKLSREEHLSFKVIIGFIIRVKIIQGKIDLKTQTPYIARIITLAELFDRNQKDAEKLKNLGTGDMCTAPITEKSIKKFNKNVIKILNNIPNVIRELDDNIKQANLKKNAYAEINRIEKNRHWLEDISYFIVAVFYYWKYSTEKQISTGKRKLVEAKGHYIPFEERIPEKDQIECGWSASSSDLSNSDFRNAKVIYSYSYMKTYNKGNMIISYSIEE